MKPAAKLILLVAVFVVATFATGFAAALVMPSGAAEPFLLRLWHHAISLGWAAGIVITALFWLTLRNQQKRGSS